MNIEKAYKLTKENFIKYGNCSQTVMTTLFKVYPQLPKDIIRTSYLLSGGGIKSGIGFCGAFAASLLAISTLKGKRSLTANNKSDAMEIAELFKKSFFNEFGILTCNEMQKKFLGITIDLTDIKERKMLKNVKRKEFCAELCGKSVKILMELL